MTIDIAIEILTEWHWLDETHPWKDMETAIKLGIEAMKAIRDTRLPTSHSLPNWLLGETEE